MDTTLLPNAGAALPPPPHACRRPARTLQQRNAQRHQPIPHGRMCLVPPTKALLDERHLVEAQRHAHGVVVALLAHVDAERQLQHLQHTHMHACGHACTHNHTSCQNTRTGLTGKRTGCPGCNECKPPLRPRRSLPPPPSPLEACRAAQAAPRRPSSSSQPRHSPACPLAPAGSCSRR